MKNLSVKRKMLEFCKLEGIKISILAEKINVSPSSMAGSNIECGLNSDNVVRFLSEFPEISAEWLMRGEGPMLRPGSPPDPSISQTIHGNVTNSSISHATAPVPNGSPAASSPSHVPDAPAAGYIPSCIPDSCPLMNAKDVLLTAKDDMIRSKDDTIAAQNTTIAALSQTIRTLQDTLASLRP